MIDNIRIQNFKCFNDIEISINQLTILAGANANGKSTVIQSLLLFRKTIEENCRLNDGKYVLPNAGSMKNKTSLNDGYLLALGDSLSVTNLHSKENNIRVSFLNAGEQGEFFVEYSTDSSESQLYLDLDSMCLVDVHPFILDEFYYLNAERVGPRISQTVQHMRFHHAGYQGEYVAQLISDQRINAYNKIDEKRRHYDNASPRLEQQINAWLNYLMPGISIVANQSIEALTAQIRVVSYFTKGVPTLSTNVGFGVSYVLPIIASGLLAKTGSYLIVENPEAHLHPSAQSKIGKFLAQIADAGVKVIIETHSEHVIHGIQLAVASSLIESKQITINYFSQNDQDLQPNVQSLKISSNGELNLWPRGFFDQSQDDLGKLFRLRKE